jgi:hypothetical protein
MATLLPPGKRQFFSASGDPLSGGTVAYFIPGTSTPQNTWQDAGQVTLNTNPITLDSAGEAVIFGSGNYRELVKDSLGNTIWDQTVTQLAGAIDSQNGVYLWGGTSTGAANTYAITLSPAPGAYVAGQTFRWLTHEANTGAATLNVNSLGAKSITKNGATALLSGDIPNGAVVEVAYDGTNFEIQTPPGTLQVTPGTGLQSSATVWSVDPSFFQGYLGGLTTSFNSTTILNIAPGVCVSDDNTTQMKLASAFTKTTGAWAVGTGNGGLDTGSVANSSGYFVYVIERTDTGVVDVLLSLSATTPTMPANYTKKRRIGWIRTDGSAAILSFVQDGDLFQWAASVADVSAANPGTTAVLRTLTVPVGINVQAIFQSIVASSSTDQVVVRYSDLATNDETPSGTNADSGNGANQAGGVDPFASRMQVRTNTSAQIRSRINVSSASVTLNIRTLGWIDTRGRFS